MGTTIEDIHYEEMLSEMHFNAVMQNEAKKQCIYIFVEGESEEKVFQYLLEGCGVDFDRDGIVVANYNGIGNLKHAIRLMSKTLSHDRPIVVTYDDDQADKEKIESVSNPLITFFKVPCEPVVTYKNGSIGGSFEESFTSDCFINACFKEKSIDSRVLMKESEFRRIFDPTKPWISQLANFISQNSGNPKSINKVEIAEKMANSAKPIPLTFERLAKLIISIRKKHPINHPDDVNFHQQ